MKIPIEKQIKQYYENDFSNFASNLLIRIKVTHIAVILLLIINATFFTTESISMVVQLIIAILIGIHDYDDNNLKKALTKNTIQAMKLNKVATKDHLTQIPNRRYFFNTGEKAFQLTIRDKADCSVLFIDLDHFKKVNDQLGHDVGDDVLKMVANVLERAIRISDVLARLGGEEFAILLPNTDLSGANILSESIRKLVEKTPYNHQGNEIAITVSIGVAKRDKSDLSLKDTLKRADIALYQAKHSGRNRTMTEAEIHSANKAS